MNPSFKDDLCNTLKPWGQPWLLYIRSQMSKRQTSTGNVFRYHDKGTI